jgi:hypothetical protein
MTNRIAAYGSIACIFFFVHCFAWSWGPCAWAYCPELFSNAQRARGVAITTTTNFVFNILVALFVPKLIVMIAFKLFLVFGACLGVMFVVTLFCVPETKGVTLESLTSSRAPAHRHSINGASDMMSQYAHFH